MPKTPKKTAVDQKTQAVDQSKTVTGCVFYGSPPTNEHDVAAVVAMSEAMKELAVAMQKIADAGKGRTTHMNAPLLLITDDK